MRSADDLLALGRRLKAKAGELMSIVREDGQGLVEYGMILVLVSVFVLAVLLLLGSAIGNLYSSITTSLSF
jgi:Flp pilus assembly pilin Flp